MRIDTLIVTPNHSYVSEPYNCLTMLGMLYLEAESKIAEEFWDFIGSSCRYQLLLDCFERVGVEMRKKMDQYFSQFKSRN